MPLPPSEAAPSPSPIEAESFSRFDVVLFADRLCRPWNLWRRLLLLAGVGSSPGAEAELTARPAGAMAQRVDAAPLLRHLSAAAAPAAEPGLAPEPARAFSPGAPAATSKARPKDAESVRSPSTSSAPGSAFALGAVFAGGTRAFSATSLLEAPGWRFLRMSSLHALGSHTRGSSGSAAANATHLVPALSATAAASAAAAADALKLTGEHATPANCAAAQSDPDAALRALAKSRSLLRLERDVAAGAGSMKALKRRARARERAEVHQGSRRGASGAATERRSTEELFGSSAASRTAKGAAELAALGPATRGPPKRARGSEAQKLRRRQRRRLK